ncbi:MAG: FAD-dependent oxidoreductase [Acidimicrobiia bacterium]|nr:FAD-dependent oxidoreductase [Acidimicrobiia bacterium]
MQRVAVIGASLAGLHAVQALRRGDYDGHIVLVGAEPHYPYDRPPLSKSVLTDDSVDESRLRLRPAADPDALGVEWRLGSTAVGVDSLPTGDGPARIRLDDGRGKRGPVVEADGLIIATGARARPLPSSEGIAGVHLLRTLDDALALRAALISEPGPVVVIGCGFIGAEVAASARTRGLDVTIVEAAPAPLLRVLDEAAGMAIADLHREHGAAVHLGVGVEEITTAETATGPSVEAVRLTDGTSLPAAVVVVGIGVIPNTEWLESSGLVIDDGVVTDETCLAAPGVVAVGDVARWPNRRFGGRLSRVEQWDNAVEMGSYGGSRLLAWATGRPVEPFEPVPWFWSDQYDRKIQLAGVPAPNAEIVQGSIAERRFVQLYTDDDDLVTGALCWNRPRQAIMARQLIGQGAKTSEIRDALS